MALPGSPMIRYRSNMVAMTMDAILKSGLGLMLAVSQYSLVIESLLS